MFYSQEQYDEYMDEMTSPPPSLADAHAHWHWQRRAGIISQYACCPLDCAEDEARNHFDEYDWEYGNIACGHCKERERSVEHVRLCASR